jgi:hypothetical protein
MRLSKIHTHKVQFPRAECECNAQKEIDTLTSVILKGMSEITTLTSTILT